MSGDITSVRWQDRGMTDDEIIDAIRIRVSEGRPTDHSGAAVPEPVSEAAITEAERVIDYPLPPLLRRIYREIANGGVGPFGGIEGLPGGYSSGGVGMINDYPRTQEHELPADEPPLPPAGVLFFCDFGCAMWSLLDCRHPPGQMWWWAEGNRDKLDLTLPGWFEAWLAGDINKTREDSRLMLPDEAWHHADED
jgi:SMI1/KNR4 family protein SUKH-1